MENAVELLGKDGNLYEVFMSNEMCRFYLDYDVRITDRSRITKKLIDDHKDRLERGFKQIVDFLKYCMRPDQPSEGWYEYSMACAHRKMEDCIKISFHLVAKNIVMRVDEMKTYLTCAMMEYPDHDAYPHIDLQPYLELKSDGGDGPRQCTMRAVNQSKEGNPASKLVAVDDATITDLLIQYVHPGVEVFQLTSEERDHIIASKTARFVSNSDTERCTLKELEFFAARLPVEHATKYEFWWKHVDVMTRLGVENELSDDDVDKVVHAFSKRSKKYNQRGTRDRIRLSRRRSTSIKPTKWMLFAHLSDEDKLEFRNQVEMVEYEFVPDDTEDTEDQLQGPWATVFDVLFKRSYTIENGDKETEYRLELQDADFAKCYLAVNQVVAYDGDQVYHIQPDTGMYKAFPSVAQYEGFLRDAIRKFFDVHVRRRFPAFMLDYDRNNNIDKTLARSNVMNAVVRETLFALADGSLLNKMDADPMLHGFENGVLHLSEAVEAMKHGEKPRVRKATPDEYVSKSHGFDFEFDEPKPELLDLFRGMFVKTGDNGLDDEDKAGQETFDCFMMQLGAMLERGNPQQIALFLIGIGSNGKSVIMSFLKFAMGDYAVGVDAAYWSTPAVSADKPAPGTLSMNNGCAYLTMDFGEDSKIDSGKFKGVTGGDSTPARTLNSRVIITVEFTGLPIICINKLPKFTENGHAITRRIRATEFPFIFVPKGSYAKLEGRLKEADDDLASRQYIKKLAAQFFNLMLAYYHKCVTEFNGKIPVSEQQKEATKELASEVDAVSPWAADRFSVGTAADKLLTCNIFDIFKKETGDIKLGSDAFAKMFKEVAGRRGFEKVNKCRNFVYDMYGDFVIDEMSGKPIKKQGMGYSHIKFIPLPKPVDENGSEFVNEESFGIRNGQRVFST